MGNKILVTGAAGFIGFHLVQKLLRIGHEVVGIDNLNDYYEVSLKESRLAILKKQQQFEFYKIDLRDKEALMELFKQQQFDYVVNLAAYAGVKYSLINPQAYVDSNVTGFLNILDASKEFKIKHLVYASTSSVYGANTKMPFSVHHNVDHPISIYAATKKANELMAHAYSNLHQIPTTGLRFFTVYGPYGRPDMALFLFTKAILADEPIIVYNEGKMKRDFTYVDDIVEGISRLIFDVSEGNPNWSGDQPDPATSFAPYRLFNIGNHQSVELSYFIEVIENCLGKKAQKNYQPIEGWDVPATYADVQDLQDAVGFAPNTPIEKGIEQFIKWYCDYYKIKNVVPVS